MASQGFRKHGRNAGEKTTELVMLLHAPDGHGTLAVQEAAVEKMLTLDEHLRCTRVVRRLVEVWEDAWVAGALAVPADGVGPLDLGQGREMTNHR